MGKRSRHRRSRTVVKTTRDLSTPSVGENPSLPVINLATQIDDACHQEQTGRRGDVGGVPETDGFCYLAWVSSLVALTGDHSYGPKYANFFGQYPCMSDVLLRLAVDFGQDVSLYNVVYVRPGLFHVDRLSYASLSVLLRSFMFTTARVGGDDGEFAGASSADRSSVVRGSVRSGRRVSQRDSARSGPSRYVRSAENVIRPENQDWTGADVDAARKRMNDVNAFSDMARTAGCNVSKYIGDCTRNFIERKVHDPHDPLVQGLCKMVRATMSKDSEFKVSDVLTAVELSMLGSAFPDFKILPLGSRHNPHAAAKVARKIAYAQVMRSFSILEDGIYVARDGVIDIGGNVMELASGLYRGVHCCTPTLDLRDSQRRGTEESLLRKMAQEGTLPMAVYEKLQSGVSSDLRCHQRSENCGVMAKNAAMIHSQYDIDLKTLGKILDAHGVERLVSVVLFDPVIITRERDHGVILDVGAHWVISKNREKEEIITFYFNGDPSLGYTHKMSSYMTLIYTSVVMTPSGRIFVVENNGLRAGSLHQTLTYCRQRPENLVCRFDHAFWSSFGEKMIITGYKYSEHFFMEGHRIQLIPHQLVLPKAYYDKLLLHMVRCRDGAFSWHDVLSVAVTFAQRMTINGMDITAPADIAVEDIFWGVVNMYVYAYRMRNDGGKMVKYLTDQTKVMRDSSDLSFGNLLYYGSGLNRLVGDGKWWSTIKEWCSKQRKVTDHLEVLVESGVAIVDFTEHVRIRAESFHSTQSFEVGLEPVDIDFSKGDEHVKTVVRHALEENSRRAELSNSSPFSGDADDSVVSRPSSAASGRFSPDRRSRPVDREKSKSSGSGSGTIRKNVVKPKFPSDAKSTTSRGASSVCSGRSSKAASISSRSLFGANESVKKQKEVFKSVPSALAAMTGRRTAEFDMGAMRNNLRMGCAEHIIDNVGGGDCCYYAIRDSLGFPHALRPEELRMLLRVVAQMPPFKDWTPASDFDCLAMGANDVQGNLTVIRMVCEFVNVGLCLHSDYSGRCCIIDTLVPKPLSGAKAHFMYVTRNKGRTGHWMGAAESALPGLFSRLVAGIMRHLSGFRAATENFRAADYYFYADRFMSRRSFDFLGVLGEADFPIIGPVLGIGQDLGFSETLALLGLDRVKSMSCEEVMRVAPGALGTFPSLFINIDTTFFVQPEKLCAFFAVVEELLSVGAVLVVCFPWCTLSLAAEYPLLRKFAANRTLLSPHARPGDASMYMICVGYNPMADQDFQYNIDLVEYTRGLIRVIRTISNPAYVVSNTKGEVKAILENVLQCLRQRVVMTGGGGGVKSALGLPGGPGYVLLDEEDASDSEDTPPSDAENAPTTGKENREQPTSAKSVGKNVVSRFRDRLRLRRKKVPVAEPDDVEILGEEGREEEEEDSASVEMFVPKLVSADGKKIAYGPKVSAMDKNMRRIGDIIKTVVIDVCMAGGTLDYLRRDFKPDANDGTCEKVTGYELIVDRSMTFRNKDLAKVSDSSVRIERYIKNTVVGKCKRVVVTCEAATQCGEDENFSSARIAGTLKERENQVLVACKDSTTQTSFLHTTVIRGDRGFDFFVSSEGIRCADRKDVLSASNTSLFGASGNTVSRASSPASSRASSHFAKYREANEQAISRLAELRWMIQGDLKDLRDSSVNGSRECLSVSTGTDPDDDHRSGESLPTNVTAESVPLWGSERSVVQPSSTLALPKAAPKDDVNESECSDDGASRCGSSVRSGPSDECSVHETERKPDFFYKYNSEELISFSPTVEVKTPVAGETISPSKLPSAITPLTFKLSRRAKEAIKSLGIRKSPTKALSVPEPSILEIEHNGSNVVNFRAEVESLVPRVSREDCSSRVHLFRDDGEVREYVHTAKRELLRKRVYACVVDEKGNIVSNGICHKFKLKSKKKVCDLGLKISSFDLGVCVFLRQIYFSVDLRILMNALSEISGNAGSNVLPLILDWYRHLKSDYVSLFLSANVYVCISLYGLTCHEPYEWVDLLNKYKSVERQNVSVRAADGAKKNDECVVVFPAVNARSRPVYCDGKGIGDFFRNSMIEFLEYLKVGDEKLALGMNEDWKVLKAVPGSTDPRYKGYTVYSNLMQKVVRKGEIVVKDYTDLESGADVRLFGFDGKTCVAFDAKSKRFLSEEDVIITNKNAHLNLTVSKVERLSKINVMTQLPPLVRWVNGVPGCGKTKFIVDKYVDGDLVLTATRAGRTEISDRLLQQRGVTDRQCVRTIDSYLMHGEKKEKRERVYVDEALMYHGGALAFVCALSGASECILVGDKQQIPFIDRIRSFPLLYSDSSFFAVETSDLDISYRCPVDIGHLMRKQDIHPKMACMSKVIKSSESGVFPGYNVICDMAMKKGGKVLFLCMTQNEKLDLAAGGCGKYGEIMTVHESQGLTREHVIMVRTNNKDVPIFTSKPHCVVAVSRHTVSFAYLGKGGDMIDRWISDVVGLDDATLISLNRRMTLNILGKMPGGGYVSQERVFDLAPSEVVRANVLASVSHMPYISHTVYMSRGIGTRWVNENELPAVSTLHGCDVAVLQTWYDAVFPGAGEFEYDADQMVVEGSDLDLYVDGRVRLDAGKMIDSKKSKWSKLKPVLRTLMPANRVPSQKESLLALIKRNLNVPNVKDPRLARTGVAKNLFDNFVASAFDEKKLYMVRSFQDNVVQVNAVELQRWLKTQKPVVERNIVSDIAFEDREYDVFEFMIKNQLKPPLELAAMWKYAALQTIAFQKKFINAMYCPVMKVLRERLIMLLRKRFIMYTDMSPEEFEVALNDRITADQFEAGFHVENDIGKYDKSQDEAALSFECMVYEYLGMDKELVKIWYAAHANSRLIDRANGISAWVNWQRRSGDASTFFGNTLYSMAVTLALYAWWDIDCGVFAGDDSWMIGSSAKMRVDRSEIFSSYFNLESKLLSYRFPMFCSKFMVSVGGWIHVIPDPVKVITKFGRSDMANYLHVEDYRRSCADYLRVFGDENVYGALSLAVTERYHTPMSDHSAIFALIRGLVADDAKFKKLFEQPNDNLCMDPSRSKLE